MSDKVHVILPKPSAAATPGPSSSHDTQINDEYEENVDALKKLAKQKSPAAQVVQDLLCETRNIREKWLDSPEPISIHDILGKYPILALPRWVSDHIS